MAEQVGGMILEKIVEKLVDPIIRQFSYLFCYKSNIKTLQDKIQDIQNTRSDVTRQVDQAHRNLEIIGSEVEAWLGKVEDIGKTADEILQGTDKITNGCLNGWCPNLKQRYLLSRKTVKQIVIVKELRNEGEKHTKLSYPALPASMAVFSTNAGSEVFESRVSKTKEVIEALKDNSVTKIGICGLGGIGKTKMAKDVYDRVKVENLFDEVAMAVVSQNLDLKNIQDQLASQLQLKLEANNSIEDRGRRLSQRLAQGKRILVILDDLWEELDLKEIGIPVGDQGHTTGCKVLITSREEHVCIAMDTHKNFTLQILSKEEAWELFKQKAGDCVVNVDLNLIARNVLNECGGLPLAIVTVATALKGFEKHVWIDALEQLKTSSATSIQGIDAKLYSSVRLSYDYLKRKYNGTKENECNQHQQLFLLCCLFPEDCDISIELLFRFATGLGFINNQDLEFARLRIQTLIDQLKSCYLLLPSDKRGRYVKMHDVIRDFGLREASGVYFSRHDLHMKEWPLNDEVERHTAISIGSREDVKLPRGLDCPLLQLLQLSGPGSVEISKDYFGAMKELKVVFLEKKSISFHCEIKSSPKTLEFFINVQTLCLESCRFETNIWFIGCLCKLKILSFYDCEIDVFPSEIRQLSNLKLLDLRVRTLCSIVPGVLLCLTKLEDLYMDNCFHVKEADECNQAGVLRRAEVVASEKVYGEKSIMKEADEDGFMKLCMWGGRVQPPSLVNLKVVEISECHDIVNLFSPSAARCLVQLQQLGVYDCNKLKEIVWKDESDTNMIGFPKLKEMRLSWLPSFKSFVAVDYNNHSGSIFNEVLLPSMETLFLMEVDDVVKSVDGNPAASYNKLETIEVDNCRSMEVVFDLEGVDVVVNENREKVIVFSQLHTITIFHLPELKHIWKNGPKEIRLQAGSHFQNLKSLNLQYCDKIEYVLSVSMAKLVVNLEEIEIFYCKSMEQVIKMDDDDDDDEEEGITRERDKIVFPQLRKLYLDSVGLKVFCQGNHHLEFPALEDVTISKCPNMINFCSGSLSTPNLMSVLDINNLLIWNWKGDLNKTVQYIYQNYEERYEERPRRRRKLS